MSSGERTLPACWSLHSAATNFPFDPAAKLIVDAMEKFMTRESFRVTNTRNECARRFSLPPSIAAAIYAVPGDNTFQLLFGLELRSFTCSAKPRRRSTHYGDSRIASRVPGDTAHLVQAYGRGLGVGRGRGVGVVRGGTVTVGVGLGGGAVAVAVAVAVGVGVGDTCGQKKISIELTGTPVLS